MSEPAFEPEALRPRPRSVRDPGRVRLVAEVRACQGCGACLLTCPEHAIRPRPHDGPAALHVLAASCTGCGECVEVCPVDAIELVPHRPEGVQTG